MGEKDDTILEVFASARTSADLVRDLAMVCFFCEKKEIKNQDPSEGRSFVVLVVCSLFVQGSSVSFDPLLISFPFSPFCFCDKIITMSERCAKRTYDDEIQT